MTKNRSFKRLVRDRMKETGERYSTARSHVLAAGAGPAPGPAMFAGVTAIGGQQPDLAAARNLCTNAGVVGPNAEPLTEAMAFGLAGGIGFLYGVFEYAEGPTMTIVARNKSMPDPFIEPLFANAGMTIDIATTTGAKKAATTLDGVIEAERPALCTVGADALPYLGGGGMEGTAPHIVGVVGATDDGAVLVDDRAPQSISVDRQSFDTARAAYRQAKHRLITVTTIDPDHRWPEAIGAAIRDGATGFDTPPVPQFASNIGQAGLEKFRRLLTDEKDQKGWPRVFASGRHAAIGLSRIHDCVEYAYTAPSAGRPLQAEFLDEASPAVGMAGLSEAATLFRTSGSHWSQLAEVAASAHPNLRRHASLADERAANIDNKPEAAVMSQAETEQRELVKNCDISASAAMDAFHAMAEHLDQIVTCERAALSLIRELMKG